MCPTRNVVLIKLYKFGSVWSSDWVSYSNKSRSQHTGDYKIQRNMCPTQNVVLIKLYKFGSVWSSYWVSYSNKSRSQHTGDYKIQRKLPTLLGHKLKTRFGHNKKAENIKTTFQSTFAAYLFLHRVPIWLFSPPPKRAPIASEFEMWVLSLIVTRFIWVNSPNLLAKTRWVYK